MNRHVYNVSMLAGWGLVSVGAALVHLPAGLVVSGGLLIALTMYSASLSRPKPRGQ